MLFRDRSITLVVLARFVARLGGEAAFFVGVWGMAAYRFEATPSQIAALMGTLAVCSMIGSAFAGVLVDRYGPRNVLIGAQLVYAPIAIAMPFAASLQWLIFGSAFFGLSVAPIMTATGSFAPYLTREPREIEKVNSLLEGAGALSFVLGPALGALIASVWSIEAVFWVDAVLTTAGVLLVWPVHTPPVGSAEHRPGAFGEVVDGIKLSYGLPSVRYYVLVGTLVWFSFGAFGALEPLFFRDVVGTGIETIGWVNSVFGAGIGAGAFLLTRLPRAATSAKGLALGVVLVGFGAVLYVGTTELVIIALGALVWGTVIGAVEPLLRTLLQLDAPPEYVGRVMGTAQLHRSAGELVPLAVAPALAAAFGIQEVLIAGGLLASVIALVTLPVAARIDRAGHREPHAVEAPQTLQTDEPISPIT